MVLGAGSYFLYQLHLAFSCWEMGLFGWGFFREMSLPTVTWKDQEKVYQPCFFSPFTMGFFSYILYSWGLTCWRVCKLRNMLEMSFLSLFLYQFCFDLILTSCFPQIRMEVALCAASLYTARDKKNYRSTAQHSLSYYSCAGLQTFEF